MSTFRRANEVRFGFYSEEELKKIVTARAELALYPDAIDSDGIAMIASLASQYGDARFAMELLERAAGIAETGYAGRITPDDIRTAGSTVYSNVSESKLEGLDIQRALTLLAISRSMKDMAKVRLVDAEKTYAVVCEEYEEPSRKHTQFWTYVRDLERDGHLCTDVRNEADGGRTTYITIEDIPPRELAMKIEYMIESGAFR